MAHDNDGHIYIDTSVTPPNGVSFADIQTVLVETSDTLKGLCQSEKINQWAKYKPVGKAKLFTSDEIGSAAGGVQPWKGDATWWKGNDTVETVPAGLRIGTYTTISTCKWFTKCGVKILGFTSPLDVLGAFNPIKNACTQSNIGSSPLKDNYSYVPPQGGDSEPFRQTDFNNYNHKAGFIIIPGYETSLGVERVLLREGSTDPVKRTCSIYTYDTTGVYFSDLNIRDLFSSVAFTVVCGVADSNDNLVPVSLDPSADGSTDVNRLITLNFNRLNTSEYYGKTVIGIYCIQTGGCYIPIFQSNYYHPNTTVLGDTHGLKCYKGWHIERTTDPLPGQMAFGHKQLYGTQNAFNDISKDRSFSFITDGLMDRWYLKVEMPRQASSPYSLTNLSFRIEFTGQFIDQNNSQRYGVVTVEPTGTVRFVLKSEEPDAMDWGTSQTQTVTPGTGTQTVYLAVYNLFAMIKQTYKSGTISQIRLMQGATSQSGGFDVVQEVVYEGLSFNF